MTRELWSLLIGSVLVVAMAVSLLLFLQFLYRDEVRESYRTPAEEVVVDGCQYLVFVLPDVQGYSITHKGNCTNH